jgi:uncharacterized protein (TIGR03000 family)
MCSLTRRFAAASAIALLLCLIASHEASAQRRGGGGGGGHSGGGAVHSSGGSSSSSVHFSGGTNMSSFSMSRSFSNTQQFVPQRQFFFTPGFFSPGFNSGFNPGFNPGLNPGFNNGGFSPGVGSFGPNTNFGGAIPGYSGGGGMPYASASPQYSSAPGYTSNSLYAPPSTAMKPVANAADEPNKIVTASYDSDDSRGDTAVLNIQLPANANLFFNGVETKRQVGSRMRRYVTPPLSPGETYKFDLRAEWMENGKMVQRSREVKVEAGNVIGVDFAPPPA